MDAPCGNDELSEQPLSVEKDDGQSLARANKRKRSAHACDHCRTKKTRCNGEFPCTTCENLQVECTYGFVAAPQAKTDIILKMVIQNHNLIKDMMREKRRDETNGPEQSTHIEDSPSLTPGSLQYTTLNPIMNATIPSYHTSGAEFMLKWPIFDDCPTLRDDILPIYYLEALRSPVSLQSNMRLPFATPSEVDRILICFSRNVNFWLPTLSVGQMDEIRTTVLSGNSNLTCNFCLAMLVMALGWASEMVEESLDEEDIIASSQFSMAKKQMSLIYFDAALRANPLAQLETSRVAAHCSFLMVLYLAFLRRPLQAWELLDSTALKCRLILSHPHLLLSADDEECVRRVFWACYILESDYLVELSGLPESRLGTVESSIPPLQPLRTHQSDQECSEALEYFLACISIRRLLNRSHHILYSRQDSKYRMQIPKLISELKNQLYSWWDCLPANLKFDLDTDESEIYYSRCVKQSARQAYLRSRFLACQCVILRPYLMEAVYSAYDPSQSEASVSRSMLPLETRGLLKKSLKACIVLALTTSPFLHTVTLSAWILSSSMVSTMLTFLAAERLLEHGLGSMRHQIVEAGEKFVALLRSVNSLHNGSVEGFEEQNPSMSQNLRLVEAVQDLLREATSPNVTS